MLAFLVFRFTIQLRNPCGFRSQVNSKDSRGHGVSQCFEILQNSKKQRYQIASQKGGTFLIHFCQRKMFHQFFVSFLKLTNYDSFSLNISVFISKAFIISFSTTRLILKTPASKHLSTDLRQRKQNMKA